jgi:hypothetical protein
MKKFMWLTGIAAVVCIISVVLHNVVSGLLNVEEPVFFVIAVIIAPAAFVVGIIGSTVCYIRRKRHKF